MHQASETEVEIQLDNKQASLLATKTPNTGKAKLYLNIATEY